MKGDNSTNELDGIMEMLMLDFDPRGVRSLLYFAYTCVRDLFIGGVIYLAKKL